LDENVCALGKGHDCLIYMYEEYNSDVVSVEDAIAKVPI
jgi:hypothetical protein